MTAPPRIALANLPTPLTFAPRLSEEVGSMIWLKRDDLTGVGLGGNKARAVEFHLGACQGAGADVFVTGGGPRSSWVLTAAAAAAARGLDCELVLFGDRPPAGTSAVDLLDRLGNLRIHFTGSPVRASVDPVLDRVEKRLRDEGRHPYVVGRGGAGPVGALGYVAAVQEIDDQAREAGVRFDAVWLAAGSCGTMAGLVAGFRRRAGGPLVVGTAVHRPVEECRRRIESISEASLDLLDVARRYPVRWQVTDQLDPDPLEVEAAATLMAGTEGVFLDPEYGSCALADLIRRAADVRGPVLFLVTGGTLNLFYGSSAA
ncbi:MAG: pyridoxal-phosphate dependent enzyme [bacterium]|nr:pyridoxal-phosphate dependent enzyme [bacterium]